MRTQGAPPEPKKRPAKKQQELASDEQTNEVYDKLVELYKANTNEWPHGTKKMAKIMKQMQDKEGPITAIQYQNFLSHKRNAKKQHRNEEVACHDIDFDNGQRGGRCYVQNKAGARLYIDKKKPVRKKKKIN